MAGAEDPGAYIPRDVNARVPDDWEAGGMSKNPTNTESLRKHHKQCNVVVSATKAGSLG